MKVMNVVLNSVFIGLSVMCLSGIAFAVCSVIISVI